MKSKIIKIIASVLALSLAVSVTGAVYAATAKDNDGASAEPETAAAESDSKDTASVTKDETVYVLASADGSVKKVIVSDWLKNSASQNKISDKSNLGDVKNVKGEEGYTMNPDNMRVWDAEGNDIYYQGTSENTLPVEIGISYKLDGKTVSAEELAGKSGKVTMRFDYTNNQKRTVKIDGKDEQIYVPFIMVTGLMLDNDNFRNIEVSNGKLLNDGSKSVVMGFAMPGLQQSLDIAKDTLEVPDYVEITADVTDFSLMTTLTVATNEVFNNIDVDDIDELSDLNKSLDLLDTSMKSLVDGSSELYGGLSTLLSKSGDLISGIDKLASGATKLKSGTVDLSNGANELNSGISELKSGLGELVKNNDSLNAGAKKVFDTLLSTAGTQLKAAGLDVPTLTIDNYKTVLKGALSSLDEESVRKLAYNTALEKVTAAVNQNKDQVTAKVTEAVRAKVTEGVLSKVGMNMTAEQYAAAVSAGKVPAETQAKISAAVDSTMQTEDIKAQISSNTEAQIKSLIDTNMKSDDVTSQINAAVEKAKNGKASINALITQLDSYNEFYTGLSKYTAGVASASDGSKKLKDGSAQLADGANQLKSGAGELSDGVNSLKDGSSQLSDGVKKLNDGSMQLSDGMKEFSEKGISKLISTGKDLTGMVDRLKAIVNVSKEYNNYSGISDDADGSVKFVFKTDSIGE